MENFISTLIWAAFIQGFLLGFLYVFSKKHGSPANRLLGFFLFALIVEGLNNFSPVNRIGPYDISQYFTTPEVKLFLPLFFIHFVLEKMGRSEAYSNFLRFHYGLALLVLAITPFNVLVHLITGSNIYTLFSYAEIDLVFMSQQCYAFLLSLLVFIISVQEVRRYKRLVKNEYSDYSLLQINWLWQFIFLMIPILILWGIELGSILFFGNGSSDIVLANWGVVVILIYFISYKAFRHQNLFDAIPENKIEAQSFSSNELKTDNFSEVEKTITSAMENDKYYLWHDLSIHDLAKETGIPSRQISTCINRNFGINFSEWVNNYRVEEAKIKLESAQNDHLSIEGIGLDAGFKSRSAMYTAFKKKTGHTPGHFRPTRVS